MQAGYRSGNPLIGFSVLLFPPSYVVEVALVTYAFYHNFIFSSLFLLVFSLRLEFFLPNNDQHDSLVHNSLMIQDTLKSN